jgi:hypothetical protein
VHEHVFVERGWLEQQLAAGKSLAEIGEVVGRDASTVGYWVKKHGLRANGAEKHAPRGVGSRVEPSKRSQSAASA